MVQSTGLIGRPFLLRAVSSFDQVGSRASEDACTVQWHCSDTAVFATFLVALRMWGDQQAVSCDVFIILIHFRVYVCPHGC